MDTTDELRVPIRAFLEGELGGLRTSEIICAAALGREHGQWPWLWLLWAALGTACASGSCPTAQDQEIMRRAAREWLELEDEETQWRAYFDRWLKELLGRANMASRRGDPGFASLYDAAEPTRSIAGGRARPNRRHTRAPQDYGAPRSSARRPTC